MRIRAALVVILCFAPAMTAACSNGHTQAVPIAPAAQSDITAPHPHTSTPALYGTTVEGGLTRLCKRSEHFEQSGCGTIFAVTTSGSETVLYRFLGSPDGSHPAGGMTAGAGHVLFGTTLTGGQGTTCHSGCGTVFAFGPIDRTPTEGVIYDFRGGKDGDEPNAPVTIAADGTIYGTTARGGEASCRCGTAYALRRSASGYVKTTLYSFRGSNDGSIPLGGLIADARGTLYGATEEGGGSSACSRGCGTLFSLSPSASGYRETVLYRFHGGRTDGARPNRLVYDGTTFFGSTLSGGIDNCFAGQCGMVFTLARRNGSFALTYVHVFGGRNLGGNPSGVMLLDKGILFGSTAQWGGATLPSVFRMAPSTGGGYTFKNVYWSSDSTAINGGLVADANGVLYGTMPDGGHDFECFFHLGCGQVFALTPAGGGYTEQTLYEFQQYHQDGTIPNGGLLLIDR